MIYHASKTQTGGVVMKDGKAHEELPSVAAAHMRAAELNREWLNSRDNRKPTNERKYSRAKAKGEAW